MRAIGYTKDSITVGYTNEDSWLNEFMALEPAQTALCIDGFLLFLNKLDNTEQAFVLPDKLTLYTDATLTRSFNYYVVKGDNVSIFAKDKKLFLLSIQTIIKKIILDGQMLIH